MCVCAGEAVEGRVSGECEVEGEGEGEWRFGELASVDGRVGGEVVVERVGWFKLALCGYIQWLCVLC